MADNIDVQDAAGNTKTVKAKDNSSVFTPYHNVLLTDVAPSVNSGNKDTGTLRIVQATDQPVMTNAQPVAAPFAATPTTDITRPADTTAYAANDNLANSTSSPTSGGFTFANAVGASGKSGIITDLIVTSSNNAATTLQGEVWIFDSSVTNINDNAAFAISDAESKTLVAKIPFTLEQGANNSHAHVQNLAIMFTTVGSADLRYLIKVKNAYTPASAEVITARIKTLQVN